MKTGHAVLKTGIGLMRGIYALMKIRPRRNKVTILSRQSDGPSADITLLADYLREKHPQLRLKVMCRRLRGGGDGGYVLHMLSQMWNMADSSVILLDGYSIAACLLNHKDNTHVVQMWHALGAIKKFGYQTLDRAGGHSSEIAEIMGMHRNYDSIICPSKATGDFFCEAFDADPGKLVLMGLPRIDIITGNADEKDAPDLRKEYGIKEDKEILLYAPTFRKNSKLKLWDMAYSIDRNKYVLVICPHPLDEDTDLEGSRIWDDGSVIVDRKHDTYSWLRACDRVITDYSAISIEASLTGKPVYFYVYDIEEYIEDEGLNVDPRKELPRLTATEPHRLAAILEMEYPTDELTRFRDRYVEADIDGCTEKLGEYIYGLAEKKN